jgi:two-component system NarL family response regulator/two-component system nitrate/nitrite response regulator NarL
MNALVGTKVVLADDHPLVLAGLVQLVEREGAEVAAACGSGAEALEAVRNTKPDIALIDINMPDLNGFTLFKAIRAQGLPSRVAFVTAMITDEQIFDAVTAGVHGLVLKEQAAEVVVKCLSAVAAGDRWLPPELIGPALQREGERRAVDRRAAELTPREAEIAALVAAGSSNKEIAAKLDITEGTVKVHLHNIFNKLEVSNRTALAALSIRARNH